MSGFKNLLFVGSVLSAMVCMNVLTEAIHALMSVSVLEAKLAKSIP